MRNLILLTILLISTNLNSQTTFKEVVSTGSLGWKRVAYSANSGGRGDFEVTIYTTGGDYQPSITKINWFKSWGDITRNDGINIISDSKTGYWTEARITFDGTNSYLEIYFSQSISSLTVFLNSELWSGGHLFTGTLPNGGGTIITSAKIGRVNFGENDFFVDYSGKVGIGTLSPTQKLEIKDGDLYLNTASGAAIRSYGHYLDFKSHDENTFWNRHYRFYPTKGGSYSTSTTVELFEGLTDGNFSQKVKISSKGNSFFNGGNIGIGTTDPGTYKLAVEGKLGAREVVVTEAPWADFVFHPTYKLKTLEEVEKYIKTNNHLPDVPSEKEVKENGLSLGQSDAVLLQKIEELTLYLIEQNKEMKKLKDESSKLKEQNVKIKELEEAKVEAEKENKAQKDIINELVKRIEKLESNN